MRTLPYRQGPTPFPNSHGRQQPGAAITPPTAPHGPGATQAERKGRGEPGEGQAERAGAARRNGAI